jgi:hypothetical protein
MPEAKFRLLCAILSNSCTFRIKSVYLREICKFDSDTVTKYRKELVDEGYIEIEEVDCPTGGYENIYHVRSLHHWDVYKNPEKYKAPRQGNDSREPAQRQSYDGGIAGSRETPDLNKTKANKTNLKNTHTQEQGGNESVPPEKPEPTVVETPFQAKTRELCERLRNEHQIVSDPNLFGKFLGLIHQTDRSKDLNWIVQRYNEWSLYLAARRDPRFDAGQALFNWAKFYREPESKGHNRRRGKPLDPARAAFQQEFKAQLEEDQRALAAELEKVRAEPIPEEFAYLYADSGSEK